MSLPPAVVPEAASTELLAWLLGQSAALVVGLLWVMSLLRQVKRGEAHLSEQSKRWEIREAAMLSELTACRERNALLSDWLCRTVETDSLERSKLRDRHLFQLDSTLRSVADLLTRVLDSLTTLPVKSSKPSKPTPIT